MLTTTLTHRLPELFDEPDSFRPDRYLQTPKAAHRLISMHFAQLEMQVPITRLLRAFDLELLDADPRPVLGLRARWPQGPCRVRYRERAVAA